MNTQKKKVGRPHTEAQAARDLMGNTPNIITAKQCDEIAATVEAHPETALQTVRTLLECVRGLSVTINSYKAYMLYLKSKNEALAKAIKKGAQ